MRFRKKVIKEQLDYDDVVRIIDDVYDYISSKVETALRKVSPVSEDYDYWFDYGKDLDADTLWNDVYEQMRRDFEANLK